MVDIKNYYSNKKEYGPSKQRVQKILGLLGDSTHKKILDVGCGNGKLGQALKENNPMCTVWGCDISTSAIAIATHVLDKAFVFDIEHNDFSSVGRDFDFIIASEVIEHLFSPKEFLLNIKKIMTKDTRLILTTPNFLMWTNRIRMLLGQFEYTETGFLDESHIHFFTYNSLKKMLAEVGLSVEAEDTIFHPKIPKSIGKIFPNLFSYQVVFKVKTTHQ